MVYSQSRDPLPDLLRVAGIVLIAAGTAKIAHFNPAVGFTGIPSISSFLFSIGAASLEFVLGIICLAGVQTRIVGSIVLALFCAFLAYSLSLAVSGAHGCGCFGDVEISPWVTSVLDAAIAVALALSLRRSNHVWRDVDQLGTTSNHRAIYRMAVCTVLAVSIAAVFVFAIGPLVSARSSHSGNGHVVLLPHDWVGDDFPLRVEIDTVHANAISSGSWWVIVHRSSCAHCAKLLQVVDDYLLNASSTQLASRVFLIELPPYDDHPLGNGLSGNMVLRGRLSDRKDWFIETPTLLKLKDNQVTQVFVGESAVHAATQLAERHSARVQVPEADPTDGARVETQI